MSGWKTNPVSAEAIKRIRHYRELRQMSAQGLSDALGAEGYPVARAVLANVENGRRQEISIDFIVHCARALGVPLANLLPDGPLGCPTCEGQPPTGFTCNTCGSAS